MKVEGIVLKGATLLTAIALIYHLVYVPLRCAHAILPIEQMTMLALANKSPLEAKRMATLNLERLTTDCRSCETDVDVYLLRSFNSVVLGRNEVALRELDKAQLFDQRPEIYLKRGELLLEMGRLDAAVEEFAMVARFSPTLIESLDPGLRSRIAAEIARSPLGERP